MELIQTNLINVGYNTNISEKDFAEGSPNQVLVNVVTWLSSQLVALCELESHVSPINVTEEEDSLGFLVEVSSLLKELCCPYKSLMRGQITERLMRPADKMLLITYLCTELEAAKIQSLKKPKKKEAPMQIELDESKTAKELREMLICLRFPKPPETITPQQLFGEVEKKLKLISQPLPPKEKIGELLFSGCLTEKQWFQLDHLYKEMYQEYKTRRNLLLTRLDVTIKSFLWADRLKAKADDILNIYNIRKNNIMVEPSVKLSHVLAAKSDLAVIEKTSSASVRKHTKSSVNNVVIGAVPDRGGRPEEQQPPPPEVPSWQKNDSSSRGGMRQSNAPPASNTGYSRDNSGYSRENTGYSRDNTGYSRDNTGYSRDNTGYSRDNTGYSRDNTSYSRDNTSYKNSGYVRDENSNPRSPTDNYRDNSSRGNYKGGNRNDYNAPPMYQPVNYCAPLGNPQFGFGGYMPAGDNFQLYGMADGMSQMNQMNQSRGGSRGSGNRGRGGYDRGSNRGGRGGRGGRNRN